MPNNLAKLLNRPDHLITESVQKLEELSGWQSTDVKLLVEINSKLRQKTSELGLDPDDTTGQELYYSLINKFEKDNRRLIENINLNPKNHEVVAESVVQTFARLLGTQYTFALKSPSAKKALLDNPPNKLMKVLNYRSIDSMVKRERINELFSVVSYTQSERWAKGFNRSIKSLSALDFEEKPIKLFVINNNYTTKIDLPLVRAEILTGTVTVNPNKVDKNSLAKLFISVFNAFEKIQVAGETLQIVQWTSSFSKQLDSVLNCEFENSPVLVGTEKVSWRSIHQQLTNSQYSEDVLSSAYNFKKLKHGSATHLLAQVNPDFKWWSELEHIAKRRNGHPVSLHIADVAENFEKRTSYVQRYVKNLGISLWDELIGRYIKYPGVEGYILNQLDLAKQPDADGLDTERLIEEEFLPSEIARV